MAQKRTIFSNVPQIIWPYPVTSLANRRRACWTCNLRSWKIISATLPKLKQNGMIMAGGWCALNSIRRKRHCLRAAGRIFIIKFFRMRSGKNGGNP